MFDGLMFLCEEACKETQEGEKERWVKQLRWKLGQQWTNFIFEEWTIEVEC